MRGPDLPPLPRRGTPLIACVGHLRQIREAGQRMRWILSPQAVAMLAPFAPADRIEVNLDGTGTIFGAPIMVSTALPAGDLLLVSASDVAANLIDAEIEASDEADITMINAEDATHVV